MNQKNDRWLRLLAAVKATRTPLTPHGEQLAPPPGFATRVAARAAHARREQLTTMWRRWSLRTALASTCLFVVAALYASSTGDSTSLLPIPAFELPQ